MKSLLVVLLISTFIFIDDADARRRRRRSKEPKTPPSKYELTDGVSKIEMKKNQLLYTHKGQTQTLTLPFTEPEFKLASFRYSDPIPGQRHFIQLFYWTQPTISSYLHQAQRPLTLLWALYEAKQGKLVHITTEEEVYSNFGSPLVGPPTHIENAVRLQVNAKQQVEWVKEPRDPELIPATLE
ncbi:MAG: hypothetical protein AB7F59_04415 [Bdellovibrionales bacterium]